MVFKEKYPPLKSLDYHQPIKSSHLGQGHIINGFDKDALKALHIATSIEQQHVLAFSVLGAFLSHSTTHRTTVLWLVDSSLAFVFFSALEALWSLTVFVFPLGRSLRLQQSDSTLHLPHQTGQG